MIAAALGCTANSKVASILAGVSALASGAPPKSRVPIVGQVLHALDERARALVTQACMSSVV